MMIDPHDPRTFRQYARVDAKGIVIGTVEVVDGHPPPVDGVSTYVDVTRQKPFDTVALPTLAAITAAEESMT